MTTNQTIDGVPRELLERLLTDACNENWSDLNELLHSPTACRCKRYGKGNPHWPCPLHASPAAQHQVEPTEEMKEAGCQAYMDADGMIGIMHRSSMGHAYQAMRALEQPAPVAVVLPERREPTQDNPYLSDADHEWNSFRDELKRVNPSL